MKLTWALGLSAALAASAVANEPRLVKDIVTAPPLGGSSDPGPMVVMGGVVYFAASGGNDGRQLWRTDGTPAGTRLAVNFTPYLRGTLPGGLAPVGVVGDRLIVVVQVGNDLGLFATDGTGDGTRLLHRQVGRVQEFPWFEVAVNGGVMCFAWAGSPLWRTDGTPEGTAVAATPWTGGDPRIAELTASGPYVYFRAYDPVHGTEMWVYDPSAGTARVLRDFSPSTVQSDTAWHLRDANGRLFFRPLTPEHGREWWTTDGTEAGTRLVADLTPGPGSSSAVESVALGDRVIFRRSTVETGAELWVTDGTAEGTSLVKDAVPGPGGVSPVYLRRAGPYVYFIGTTPETGAEPWRTDGTEAGTFGIDARPGAAGSFIETVGGSLVAVGSGVFYFGRAASGGTLTGLWRCDGTPEGTQRVADVNGWLADGRATDLNGRLIFLGGDPWSAGEPWVSDGTAAGTGQIKDINSVARGALPLPIGEFGGRLLFRAQAPATGQPELFVSDGTAPGTFSPLTLRPAGRVSLAAVGGPRIVAVCDVTASSAPAELWVTDLTPEGTAQVATLETRGGLTADTMVFREGKAYFTHARVPYASDGTSAGTVRLASATAPGGAIAAEQMTVGAAAVYFRGWVPGGASPSLYSTDGTPAGTRATFVELSPFFTALDGRLYVSWFRDGFLGVHRETDAGAFQTLGAAPRMYSDAQPFCSFRGQAVFAATAALAEWHSVYTVDPGAPTATRVLPPPPGVSQFLVRRFAEVGDRLLMLASTVEHGYELWTTDLTPEGTSLLADIVPGPGSAFPRGASDLLSNDFIWARAGNLLYFTAYSMAHGQELWVTDGTPAGTRLAADVEPGAGSSQIRGPMMVVGEQLYFSANAAGAGSELWTLRVACRANFDGSDDGVVDLADVFAFLQAWFASDPATDLDGDGAAAVPDVFAFLGAWFTGCG